MYATEWCPWSGIDVTAVGAYAGVVAELVAAGMALDARDAEVAELTQAVTARVWVEQARPGNSCCGAGGVAVAVDALALAI